MVKCEKLRATSLAITLIISSKRAHHLFSTYLRDIYTFYVRYDFCFMFYIQMCAI